MGIRKYALAFAVLIMTMLFAFSAQAADETKAYYLVEGTYNETDNTYTVDVYLDTEVYLAAGTFGMEFDANIPVTWNDGTNGNSGYLQIDTGNFEYLETRLFKQNRDYFKNNHYVVVQWGLKGAGIKAGEPFKGRIKLGSFTINDVHTDSEGKVIGWSDTPFRLLDWSTTDLAKTETFTYKDENDGYGKSLNEEIWRSTTAEEREELGIAAVPGYYQGSEYDEDQWIDIGFVFTSNTKKQITITGWINAWNPKNDPVIYAYKTDTEVFEGEIKQRIIYPDGRVKYGYAVEVDDTGDYTMVIQKSVHLTYKEAVSIPYTVTDEYAIPHEVTLICGDINGDEYIKIPDRSRLILMLNHPARKTTNPTEFDLCDLNGDGRITLTDLNILKSNIDKTYL